MCLALIALQTHPRYAVVIVANRDEFHARPAAAAGWWDEGWLAGRDLEAGGTWLGVARDGRYAFLTNVREPQRQRPGAPSRGALVPRVLAHAGAPDRRARGGADGGRRPQRLQPADRRCARRALGKQPRRVGRRPSPTASPDSPTPRWIRPGRRSSGPRRDSRPGARPGPPTPGRCSRCSATTASLPTTRCRRPACRWTGNAGSRRRSSSASATGRVARRSITIGRDGVVSFVERRFDAAGARHRRLGVRVSRRRRRRTQPA